jgi:hypothetical protein
LRSPSRSPPDASTGAFSTSLTTDGIQPPQHVAVWSLPPQGDSEGPNLHLPRSTASRSSTYIEPPSAFVTHPLVEPGLRHPQRPARHRVRDAVFGPLGSDHSGQAYRPIASLTQRATERLRPPMSPTCQAAASPGSLIARCGKALIGS